MKSFKIEAEIAGNPETLLVVPVISEGDRCFRLIKDGIEFCTLKQNGEFGWEIKGMPLNAEILESIGRQIREKDV